MGLSERGEALAAPGWNGLNSRMAARSRARWESWANWERSVARFWRAKREMYPEDLNDRVAAVAIGEPEAVEWALTFSEVDPRCFRRVISR